MVSDSFLQLRAALDTTTEIYESGAGAGTTAGAVFIQKEIDRMIRETINKNVDFRPLVPRKTIRQLAYIWNLETSLGSTAKTAFYADGATGTPYPNQYLQLVATAKALRSDYEVTGLAQAASSSYFDALDKEARSALQALALTEEQAFILGDDATSESTGVTLNGLVGVTGSYKGLKQQLHSAVAMAAGDAGGTNDTTAIYGSTPSSTSTDRQYALNCKVVCTAANAENPLSLDNLDAAITASNEEGGKNSNRIFLCSERRMDKIWQLLQPQGRFVIGAGQANIDGGGRVLTYRGIKIIGSRFMRFYGFTSTNGTSLATGSTADEDHSVLLLDMDNISFYNVAGVDARHVPIMGLSTAIRSDVEGGYYKTYGTFVVEKFNTQVLILNLSAPED